MATNAEAFEPNDELLNSLLALGITKNKAEEALFCTGNDSLDAAVSFLVSNESSSEAESADEDTESHKMVFVVNTSLGMSVGKLAAQVAHACLGLYRGLISVEKMKPALEQWETNGEKKVVLKGANHLQLNQLYEKAQEEKMPCELIHDAGRTEIPRDSVTVFALFGLEADVNKVTGSLSLLH